MNKEYKASELAELVRGTVVGNPDTVVNAVNSLKLAERNEVSFLNNAKYLKAQRESHAGIVLVPNDWKYEPPEGQTNIHCEDPDKAGDILEKQDVFLIRTKGGLRVTVASV